MRGGILGGTPDDPKRNRVPEVPASIGLRVIHRGSRVGGTVVKLLPDGVVVRLSTGERSFRFLDGGFIVGGRIVTLVPGRAQTPSPKPTARTASGSLGVPDRGNPRAKVARASRLWVEGIHDAALLERVWGDDLRDLAIVVERLDGLDHVVDRVREFAPGPSRQLGILVDHLVPGTKEARLAAEVEGPYVTVRGTPYIDIWQAIRPNAIGIDRWPHVPRGEDWKTGVCARLGVGDPPAFWTLLLASVTDYTVLESSLIAAVEGLLDALGGTD